MTEAIVIAFLAYTATGIGTWLVAKYRYQDSAYQTDADKDIKLREIVNKQVNLILQERKDESDRMRRQINRLEETIDELAEKIRKLEDELKEERNLRSNEKEHYERMLREAESQREELQLQLRQGKNNSE